jgi:hypothetical protein
MFCPVCDNLTEMGKCRDIGCSNYSESAEAFPIKRKPKRTEIPPEITRGAQRGLLGFYNYTINDDDVVRRSCLLSLYVDELITEPSALNQGYVNLLGPPESNKRVARICDILLGLNVSKQVNPRIRESDAEYLRDYHQWNIL